MVLLLSLLVVVAVVLLLLVSCKQHKKCCSGANALPPGPPWPRLPLLGNLLYRCHTTASLAAVVRRLHAAYGPIVAVWAGGDKPAIFIAGRDATHLTLVRAGATFAHRPPSWSFGLNAHGINSAPYGSRWSLLRRNLSSHLVTARAHDVAAALRSSLDRLLPSLESAAAAADDGVVVPSEMFRDAVFSFFASLCFGEGVGENVLSQLRGIHSEILSLVVELGAFHLMPALLEKACYLPKLWRLSNAEKKHRVTVMALISARRRETVGVGRRCYVDTLLQLGLTEEEMVSLCWEFMNAAAKTTSTALEWIMARLVLHQDIQQKLCKDIARTRRVDENEGRGWSPFLEAVILEALRRHPPAHYLLAHTTDKDVYLDGYVIPKGSIVNYGVADMGRDVALWTSPDEFLPERFLEGGEGYGLSFTNTGGGNREDTMKMMPFGCGRRACPGMGVALTVLKSFVDNLVTKFEWKPAGNGDKEMVDMEEKPGLVNEMRTPLHTYLVVRQHN